jgi:hypothetical protein
LVFSKYYLGKSKLNRFFPDTQLMVRALHNRIATLFRHSALDAESSYDFVVPRLCKDGVWIPASAGMT